MLTLRIPADRPIAFALGTIGGAGGYKYRMLGAQLGESRGSRELYVYREVSGRNRKRVKPPEGNSFPSTMARPTVREIVLGEVPFGLRQIVRRFVKIQSPHTPFVQFHAVRLRRWNV